MTGVDLTIRFTGRMDMACLANFPVPLRVMRHPMWISRRGSSSACIAAIHATQVGKFAAGRELRDLIAPPTFRRARANDRNRIAFAAVSGLSLLKFARLCSISWGNGSHQKGDEILPPPGADEK